VETNHHFSQDWNPMPHGVHTPSEPPRKTSTMRKRRVAIVASSVAAVLLVGGVVAWLVLRPTKHTPAATAGPSSSQQQASGQSAESSAPKTFKSSTLNIECTYPGTWRVRESADKSQIMLTSPQVTYQKAGVSTQGVFTLKMRSGIIPQAMQTTLQNITAVKKSEVIAYANPTEQQRQYTNLSFGGKGDKISLLMVTGGTEFAPGDTFASGLDMQGAFYLFAGGYGSDPNDSLTFDNVPLGSFIGTAVYDQAVSIIESVKVY
jgi:hypothetical protein